MYRCNKCYTFYREKPENCTVCRSTNITQTKPAHGGARAGAGRPKSSKPRLKRGITITVESERYLRQLGVGNLSAGIEIAAERLMK